MKRSVKAVEILMLTGSAVWAQGVIRTDFIRNTDGTAASD
jgi:hypothetical protein